MTKMSLNRYRSRVRINGHHKHIGVYLTPEKALEADKVARGEQNHNFFLNQLEFDKIIQIREAMLKKPKAVYKNPILEATKDLNTKLDLILELLRNTHKQN